MFVECIFDMIDKITQRRGLTFIVRIIFFLCIIFKMFIYFFDLFEKKTKIINVHKSTVLIRIIY